MTLILTYVLFGVKVIYSHRLLTSHTLNPSWSCLYIHSCRHRPRINLFADEQLVHISPRLEMTHCLASSISSKLPNTHLITLRSQHSRYKQAIPTSSTTTHDSPHKHLSHDLPTPLIASPKQQAHSSKSSAEDTHVSIAVRLRRLCALSRQF